MSRYLGLQVGTQTGTIYGLINPDSDAQLRDPQLLRITDIELVKLVKMHRRSRGALMSPEDANAVVTAYKEQRR